MTRGVSRPLRIAFVMGTDFHAETVEERPLGGSESAVCYLARALGPGTSGRGHDITLFTLASEPSIRAGIKTVPLIQEGTKLQLPSELLRGGHDVVILKNGLFEIAPRLRQHLASSAAIWAWTGHAADQPAMGPFEDVSVVRAIDRVVFLSQWQRSQAQRIYPLLQDQPSEVIRHAVSPRFERLFADESSFKEAKLGGAIELAYTSTPFRGLATLLQIQPQLYQAFPEATTHIYSSMAIYGVQNQSDPHGALYEQAQRLGGVVYHGPKAQPVLAQRLRSHSFLAYPNTFDETSCIAVMEAMASGLQVVSTARGALQETTRGHARLVPPGPKFAARYLSTLADEMNEWPNQVRSGELWEQVVDMNRTHTWAHRAQEWEAVLRAQVEIASAEHKLAL